MIPVQNVYYMLSYAFQVLNEQGYKQIATEKFENVAELCAAILTRGVSLQLKRGLGREYVEYSESLSTPRGHLEITGSLKSRSLLRRHLICTYDEFSVNTYPNRIIRTTMEILLRSDITKARKQELRKLLVYFDEVDQLDAHRISWRIQYNRNNQSYRMLVSICYLVIKGLLQTQSEGSFKLMDFLDEQRMSHLYEKFVLEYFKKEHPELHVSASQIPWALDDGFDEMLPIMQSDITLSRDNRILIIDAKYYSSAMQSQYGSNTIHSDNLYQIFAYVKNMEATMKNMSREVSGMLLYAGTDEEIQPKQSYRMSGNRISACTLNLNCDFSMISAQLDEIADEFFQTQQ